MSKDDEELVPAFGGYTDMEAMQQVLDQMQALLNELQWEVHKETEILDQFAPARRSWLESHPEPLTLRPFGSFDAYAAQLFCPKASLDQDPQKGRVLRATAALAPAEVFLVEPPLLLSHDEDHKGHEELLGRFLGVWGLLCAIKSLDEAEMALFDALSNAHEDSEVLVEAVASFRASGLLALPEHPVAEAARCLGIAMTNAFEYKRDAHTHRGIFPMAAMLSHSCKPNAMFAVEAGRLFFHATRAIEPGEELTHTYVNATIPPQRKKEILRETFGFVCQCGHCS